MYATITNYKVKVKRNIVKRASLDQTESEIYK